MKTEATIPPIKLKRESLFNIRTLRDIVGSLDLARVQPRLKTTNLLARGGRETQPQVNQAVLAVALDQERRRFQRRLESLARSQVKILGARQKLANLKEKNRRIMDLRVKLYKHYWTETFPSDAQRRPREGGASSPHVPSGGPSPGFPFSREGRLAARRPQAGSPQLRTLRYGGHHDAEA